MRSLPAVAAVSAALVALAGCGGGSGSSGLGGKSPQQALDAAASQAGSAPLRFDLTGALKVDASKVTGITPDQLRQFGGIAGGLSVTIHGEQESAARATYTVDLRPAVRQTVTVVLYDGGTFFSYDGKRFGRLGSITELTGGLGLTPDATLAYLRNLPNLQDAGATTQDGVAVETLRAVIDRATLSRILGAAQQSPSAGAGQSSGAAILAFVAGLLQIQSGELDSYVRQDDGRLDRSRLDLAVGLDLSQIAGFLGGSPSPGGGASGPSSASPATVGGVLGIHLTLDTHFFDYGATIHVTRPAVDPNPPAPPSLGG